MDISFYIPIEDAISRFHNHLLSHERTIFSAGFGEGKTYFLSRCMDSMDNVCFITLHPINYQILDNRDVYDVMKRDILLQLISNNIIESNNIRESVVLSFFLLNNISSLSLWALKSIATIGYPDLLANKILNPLRDFLSKIKQKYYKFCKDTNINDKKLQEIWEELDAKAYYISDPIGTMIRESIIQWKRETQKRIVLLIEDMDRIDPGQLFRILNVLSAQIDDCIYDDNDGISNKFCFDNIVCVLDLDNFHSIYHHFYGTHSSADGYISKFSNKGYFEYSLTHQKAKYVYQILHNLTGIQSEIIKTFVNEDSIRQKSMRTLVGAFDDIHKQVISTPPILIGDVTKYLPQNLLLLSAILIRLGLPKSQIKTTLLREFRKQNQIHRELIPFAFVNHNYKDISKIYFGERTSNNYWLFYDFTNQKQDKPDIEYRITNFGSISSETKIDCSPEKIIENMLNFVND